MAAEKRSVSAPAQLFAQADDRKEQLGYATFSDYIQALIRADTLQAGSHLREPATPYVAASSSTKAAEQGVVAAVALEGRQLRRKTGRKPSAPGG